MSLQFYLKHSRDENYFCTKLGKDSNTLTFCPTTNDALDLEITHVKDGIVTIKPTSGGNKTFDIANGDKLIVYPHHGGLNQQFTLIMVAPNRFAIKNRGKCVEYMSDTTFYHLKNCTFTNHQIFTIIPNEQEKLELSGAPDESYYGNSQQISLSTQEYVNEPTNEVEIPTIKKARKGKHGRKHCHLKCY
ncbi:hypothetical protein NGRA_2673 [Nosema granulosis]|uniref:Ricin B lectin domain-containing protein n=1 Tax=Nosema granulosis TaxID=83296 RepID=A0A9P6GZE6_9MICR|nr:hypothetical protein NGRA_2673 [Nosema granulosis]